MRKLVVLAFLAVVVIAVGAWVVGGCHPPGLILHYGLAPGCEPTGRTMTIEGIEFVEIGPGVFLMGSEARARGGDLLGRVCASFGLPWGRQPWPSNEMPVHWVRFRNGFWIARCEVTNVQYEAFDQRHERRLLRPGGIPPNDRHPVVNVSWEEAKSYSAWLAGKSGLPIRLPSEAEWECACRAGSRTEFCFGDDERELPNYAWFGGTPWGHAHEVGTRRANEWGLFDLHGNAWERCEDIYHESYEGAPSDGSAWTVGSRRIASSAGAPGSTGLGPAGLPSASRVPRTIETGALASASLSSCLQNSSRSSAPQGENEVDAPGRIEPQRSARQRWANGVPRTAVPSPSGGGGDWCDFGFTRSHGLCGRCSP